MNNKLIKLDSIEASISHINVRLMNLEKKVQEIESVKEKVNNFEECVNLVTSSFDEWKGAMVTISPG